MSLDRRTREKEMWKIGYGKGLKVEQNKNSDNDFKHASKQA